MIIIKWKSVNVQAKKNVVVITSMACWNIRLYIHTTTLKRTSWMWEKQEKRERILKVEEEEEEEEKKKTYRWQLNSFQSSIGNSWEGLFSAWIA